MNDDDETSFILTVRRRQITDNVAKFIIYEMSKQLYKRQLCLNYTNSLLKIIK